MRRLWRKPPCWPRSGPLSRLRLVRRYSAASAGRGAFGRSSTTLQSLPFVSQVTALVEQIATPVRGLDLYRGKMGHCHLTDLGREIRAFRRVSRQSRRQHGRAGMYLGGRDVLQTDYSRRRQSLPAQSTSSTVSASVRAPRISRCRGRCLPKGGGALPKQSAQSLPSLSLDSGYLGVTLSQMFTRNVAHPARFELTTSAFGGQRSIQLSYGCRAVLYPAG